MKCLNKIFFIILILHTSITSAAFEDQYKVICSDIECYSIIKVLGEGAFGKVYAVENPEGTKYALKMYKTNYYNPDSEISTSFDTYPSYTYSSSFSSPSSFYTSYESYEGSTYPSYSYYYEPGSYPSFFSSLEDPQREFELGQVFDHPNIIKSYYLFSNESGQKNETHYLVLQLVDGKTVSAAEHSKLPNKQTKIAAKHLVNALYYASKMDYFHIDLHTNNVMLDKGGDIMVVDLASFFSLEELLKYQRRTKNGLRAKNIEENINPLQEKKLERFFNKHPELMEQIETRSTLLSKHISSKDSLRDSFKVKLNFRLFEGITNLVVYLIKMSDLGDHEKRAITQEIDNVTWILTQKMQKGEGSPEDMDIAVDEVLHILE